MTIYQCNKCDFKTPIKTKWNNHLKTKKHIITCGDISCNSTPENEIYICPHCGKNSNFYKSFWYHMTKSRCSKENINKTDFTPSVEKKDESKDESKDEPKDEIQMLQQTIQDMMKIQTQQMEQNAQMLEVIKLNTTNNSVTNSTINNNIINGIVQNNNFNLNVFLNEQCKDAINITDYINNIQLQLEDLEATTKLGYTEGITKIINDRVKECGLFQRPFHCTDKKREIVYVKDNDIWEKEQSDKPKMKKMITNVIHKNIQQLVKWHEKFPECADSESQRSSEFLHMMIEANGGETRDREKKEEIIMKNILKEVIVEK